MTHYQFDEVYFDTTNGELAGSDQRRHLRSKTAALLSYLIAHRDRVIDKEELFREIWDDAVVSDATLVQSIQELRKALGDSARAPRFIRTYPRRGYQWVCEVKEVKKNQGEVSSQAPEAHSGRIRFLLVLFIAAIGVVLLLNSRFANPSLETGSRQENQASLKVLIPPFHNETGREDLQWLELGLRDLIISALDKTIIMEPVSQVAYFQAALKRGPDPSRPDPAALAGMLPGLEASYAIHGRLILKKDEVRFLFQVIGHDGSLLLETVSYAQLLENLPGIVAKIAGTMQPGSTSNEVKNSWSAVADANAEYLHGLQYRKTRGEAFARVYFEAALKQDNGFTEARLQLALCHYRLGEWQPAGKHYAVLLRQARASNNPKLEAKALLGQARVLSYRGSFSEAESLVRKALAYAQGADDAYHHAAVLRQLGHIRLLRGYGLDQRQLYQRAQEITTALNDPLSRAEDLYHLGSTDGIADNSATNKKLLELALRSFEELGDQEARAFTLLHLGKHRLVPAEQRRRNLETALDLFESRGNLVGAAFCLEIMGITQAMVLQGEVGLPIMQRSLDLARKTGARFREAEVIYGLGVVSISATIGLEGVEREAMIARAEGHLREALVLFGVLDLADRMAACRLVMALTAAERGDYEQAESLVSRSLAVLKTFQIPEAEAMAHVGRAHLAMRQNKWREALPELEQATSIFPVLTPMILGLEAHCHYALEHFERAFEIELSRKKQMGSRWQEANELLLGTYAAAAKSGRSGEVAPVFSLISIYFKNR